MLMRIFLSMGLVEHTGHGIPTIVERYGEEAFEIENNYIKCTIHFDKEVMEKSNKNNCSRIKYCATCIVKTLRRKSFESYFNKSDDSALKMSEKIGLSQRTVERAFNKA